MSSIFNKDVSRRSVLAGASAFGAASLASAQTDVPEIIDLGHVGEVESIPLIRC